MNHEQTVARSVIVSQSISLEERLDVLFRALTHLQYSGDNAEGLIGFMKSELADYKPLLKTIRNQARVLEGATDASRLEELPF